MPTQDQRLAGMLFGSFTAEALSLGVHWIYDTDALKQKSSYVDSYAAPGADSYHPKKQAGEQGHVGDQALQLAKFLNQNSWNTEAFMESWIAMWPDYDDYIDHATKTTLENLKTTNSKTEAGSDSSELAGPARIAPLIASLFTEGQSKIVEASVQQTELTHKSQEATETATFLAEAAFHILNGAGLQSTVEDTAPQWALEKAKAALNLDATAAIKALGQSCSISAALPSVIYLALKHGDDLPKAFAENALAGGDNCARALALGILLGAAHGIEAIPSNWRTQLRAADVLNSLLA